MEEGEKAHFSELESELFEDTDFEVLFEPACDGIDQSRVGKAAGMTSLAFQDWFKPFGEDQLDVYQASIPSHWTTRHPDMWPEGKVASSGPHNRGFVRLV